MSILSKLIKIGKVVFDKAFNEYLLTTNVVSSVILMQMGDWIQQEIEYQKGVLPKRYDYARMARMATVGIGYGIFHHYFYTALGKLWPAPNLSSTVKKIVVDQMSMSPMCIVYFFYAAGALEGKSLSESTDELKRKFVKVFILDMCIWPPSQYVNFLYVPVKYQVLYVNGITMVYDVFLSYAKHNEDVEDIKKEVPIDEDAEQPDEVVDPEKAEDKETETEGERDARKKVERFMDYRKKRKAKKNKNKELKEIKEN